MSAAATAGTPCAGPSARPDALVVGLDAETTRLDRALAAARKRKLGVLFVTAAAEHPPEPLRGRCAEIAVVMPWGSLLDGILGADPDVLRAVLGLGAPGATLDAVVNVRPWDAPASLDRKLAATPEPTAEHLAPLAACTRSWAGRWSRSAGCPTRRRGARLDLGVPGGLGPGQPPAPPPRRRPAHRLTRTPGPPPPGRLTRRRYARYSRDAAGGDHGGVIAPVRLTARGIRRHRAARQDPGADRRGRDHRPGDLHPGRRRRPAAGGPAPAARSRPADDRNRGSGAAVEGEVNPGWRSAESAGGPAQRRTRPGHVPGQRRRRRGRPATRSRAGPARR